MSALYHLAHAASQGQIDPILTRELGKQIYSEIDALKSENRRHLSYLDALNDAVARFNASVTQPQGELLLNAVRRMSHVEAPGAAERPAPLPR